MPAAVTLPTMLSALRSVFVFGLLTPLWEWLGYDRQGLIVALIGGTARVYLALMLYELAPPEWVDWLIPPGEDEPLDSAPGAGTT